MHYFFVKPGELKLKISASHSHPECLILSPIAPLTPILCGTEAKIHYSCVLVQIILDVTIFLSIVGILDLRNE